MTPHDRIAWAQKVSNAREVLDPALLKVRDTLIEQLAKASPAQPNSILGLHASIQAVDAVKQLLIAQMDDGKVAEFEHKHRDQTRG